MLIDFLCGGERDFLNLAHDSSIYNVEGLQHERQHWNDLLLFSFGYETERRRGWVKFHRGEGCVELGHVLLEKVRQPRHDVVEESAALGDGFKHQIEASVLVVVENANHL